MHMYVRENMLESQLKKRLAEPKFVLEQQGYYPFTEIQGAIDIDTTRYESSPKEDEIMYREPTRIMLPYPPDQNDYRLDSDKRVAAQLKISREQQLLLNLSVKKMDIPHLVRKEKRSGSRKKAVKKSADLHCQRERAGSVQIQKSNESLPNRSSGIKPFERSQKMDKTGVSHEADITPDKKLEEESETKQNLISPTQDYKIKVISSANGSFFRLNHQSFQKTGGSRQNPIKDNQETRDNFIIKEIGIYQQPKSSLKRKVTKETSQQKQDRTSNEEYQTVKPFQSSREESKEQTTSSVDKTNREPIQFPKVYESPPKFQKGLENQQDWTLMK